MVWASLKTKHGFTIVELLIVIVVIAILAAITIVAFTGMQNRAKNQQTVSAVRTYYAALSSYAVKNNTLPAARACLGPASFYTANPCYIGGSTYTWNSALYDALAEVISNQPTTAPGTVSSSTITASGLFYDNQTGASGNGYIGFPIFSESTCPVVAGAELVSTSTMGAHMYCRIKTPTY
jgi:prepilin-type N-terminal cleavage/methylation domain-containing protein